MKSATEIDKRITDLSLCINPQNTEDTFIQKGKIDTLIWIKNNGKLQSIEALNHRIKIYKEECLVYDDRNDLHYREKLARIQEIEDVM